MKKCEPNETRDSHYGMRKSVRNWNKNLLLYNYMEPIEPRVHNIVEYFELLIQLMECSLTEYVSLSMV